MFNSRFKSRFAPRTVGRTGHAPAPGKGGVPLIDPNTLFAAGQVGVCVLPGTPYGVAYKERTGASATTVCGHGDPVGTYHDLVTGRYLIAPSGREPTYQIVGGWHFLLFDGGNDRLNVTFTISQPWDRFSAIQQVSWTASDALFGQAVGTDNYGVLYQTASSPYIALRDGSLAAVNGDAAIGADVVVTEHHEGEFSRLGVESLPFVTGDPGTGLPGGLSIGGTAANTTFGNFRLHGLIMREGSMPFRQQQQVKALLASRQGRAQPKNAMWENNPRVICDGNSLTAGSGASNASLYSYPAQMGALLPGWTIENLGVPGASIASRVADAPAQIDNRLGMNRQLDVAVLWEITNSLYYAAPTDPTATIDAYVAWCKGRKAAGFKVIAVTVLPRTQSGTYADFEAHRQIVNAYIRANWTSFADGLADVAADARIGDPGASDDTTYYDGSQVHLNDTGYAIVAAIVAAAVLSCLV